MGDGQEILKADEGLSFADQLAFMNDVEPVIIRYDGSIAALHPRGVAFVEEVKEGIKGFKLALEKMDKEVVEADSALGANTTHQDAIHAYLLFILSKIEIIETLGEEPADVVRALRKAYGLTGNRLSLNRRSHQLRRLTQMVGAHKVHNALLKKYRVTQEQLDEGQTLLDELPGFTATLTKELSEKEEAVSAAHAAEAEAVSLVNKVIALANHDRDAYPELFKGLLSATAKHRAKLLPDA
jgi:hypothetical protein